MRVGAEQVGDFGVACDYHAFKARWVVAHIVGHLVAAGWGQLSRMWQGRRRVRASKAADHALGAGAAYPDDQTVALVVGFGVPKEVKSLDAEPSPRELTRQRA